MEKITKYKIGILASLSAWALWSFLQVTGIVSSIEKILGINNANFIVGYVISVGIIIFLVVSWKDW